MRDLVLTRAALAAALLVLLAACGSSPRTPVAAGPAAPAAAATEPPLVGAEPAPPPLPAAAPLAAEARWLGELFAGTPVQVSGERDGSVRLQVPLKYAFDAGPPAAAPKPPLQAVLDKLSQSLKRQPGARLQAAAAGPSAEGRQAAIRSHLAGKGVAATRLLPAGTPLAGHVLLRLVPGPVGLKQLDDSTLPATGAGRPPQPAPRGG